MNNELLLKKFNKLLEQFKFLKKYKNLNLPLAALPQLRKIPVSTRDELRRFDLTSSPWPPFNITATSGSIESRLIVCHSKFCHKAHLKRLVKKYKSIGLKKGDCCLNLCSYSLGGGGRIMEQAFKLIGITVIPFGEIATEEKLKEAVEVIYKIKPNIINSYVNQIFALAEIIKSNHRVKKCILNGETLPNEFKRRVSRTLGAEIYDNYGSMEFSGFAISHNTEDDFMELFDDDLFIEVLKKNGSFQMNGKGKIVITDLNNYSMPFIRYILGDGIEIKTKGMKRLIRVCGRSDDNILWHGEVESKKKIENRLLTLLGHPYFCLVFSKDKISQKDKIVLHIFNKAGNHEVLNNRIKKYYSKINEIRFFTKSVPRTHTGKFKHFMDLR